MCKEREYKRLDTVSNAFSVPVPGTREKTRRSSFFCTRFYVFMEGVSWEQVGSK